MVPKPLLRALFRQVRGGGFELVHPDGEREAFGDTAPQFAVMLRDLDLRRIARRGLFLGLGEAYMDGQIEIRGDLADLVTLALTQSIPVPSWLQPYLARATARVSRRSRRRQQQDIAHHYDLGNDFYRLWLDESLTYTCAYFHSPDDTLEAAQRQKIDHVLRKVRPKPGERLLDIGCGWGAVLLRAAEQYGVQASGITLSEEQVRLAGAEIRRRGLENKTRIRLASYTDLAAEGVQFDRIVSVGMLEAVGQPHLSEFAEALARLLRPGGLALIHTITRRRQKPVNAWIDTYVFPGGYIPTLPELLTHFSTANLHVLDVENLRPHYILTLDHWSERFERVVPQVRERFGDRFVRMWRLYLRGACGCFRAGSLELHQVLVSHGLPAELPLTREDLYR
jgi:cyclopropane-fatty-acyl-phospholipid synthase